MNNQKEESKFGKPQPNDSHGDSENGQAHDIDVMRSYDSDIGNIGDRSTEIREKEYKELAIDFNQSVSDINRTENSQEHKMTKEEKIDNRGSEEGDEGIIYNQPIERESMGLESDLPEEDEIIGEDQPDGIKKIMRKAAKAIACGLKPKTKDEDKTPYSQHFKDRYAVSPETGSMESNFERGMPPTDTGQEFDERLSYRRAVSAGTVQRMKETHIKSSQHTSHTVPVALNEIEMYEPHASNTHIPQPSETPTMADDDSEDVYNFNHPTRGYMVIIVNDRFKHQPFRDGAECDLRHMKEMARKLGYRIQNTHFCKNLTQFETIGVLKNAKTADHSQCDSFALMISTHGLEQPNSKARGKMDHALVCADDKMIFTSTITEMFNDENCPTLKGKPKLFFIQACRGENLDSGSTIRILGPESTADKKRGKSTDFT
ncbi:CASP3-like protein [Mya arenaria]|uniref:CASP3-like protein n=1 Tax=Mya arenaria TaxID=6604 RepID=A0ABY7DCZ3_MYAAR|nr:CASP3-like protein [Mya arenaria]